MWGGEKDREKDRPLNLPMPLPHGWPQLKQKKSEEKEQERMLGATLDNGIEEDKYWDYAFFNIFFLTKNQLSFSLC